jgi:hypothetical protein
MSDGREVARGRPTGDGCRLRRRPGADVVAAHPVSWPRAGLVVDRKPLDGAGEAELAVAGSAGRDFYVRGRLLGPDGGFLAHVVYNYADPSSDVTESAVADLILCATSDVAAPTLAFPGLPGSPGVAGPLSTIWLAPDSPLADDTPDAASCDDPDGGRAALVDWDEDGSREHVYVTAIGADGGMTGAPVVAGLPREFMPVSPRLCLGSGRGPRSNPSRNVCRDSRKTAEPARPAQPSPALWEAGDLRDAESDALRHSPFLIA